jgi:hypothetical protein
VETPVVITAPSNDLTPSETSIKPNNQAATSTKSLNVDIQMSNESQDHQDPTSSVKELTTKANELKLSAALAVDSNSSENVDNVDAEHKRKTLSPRTSDSSPASGSTSPKPSINGGKKKFGESHASLQAERISLASADDAKSSVFSINKRSAKQDIEEWYSNVYRCNLYLKILPL